MIVVVDYGMGNLRSIGKAFEQVGADVKISSVASDLEKAERLVLPGVGAFIEAMTNLLHTDIANVLHEEVMVRKKPFLGICLGMQLLAKSSIEHGRSMGLGWLDAEVLPIEQTSASLHVPHTGWNTVQTSEPALAPFDGIRPGEHFYFNHSFHFVPKDESIVAAQVEHGRSLVAAIRHENIAAATVSSRKESASWVRTSCRFS